MERVMKKVEDQHQSDQACPTPIAFHEMKIPGKKVLVFTIVEIRIEFTRRMVVV
jgi:hypothetical protein